MKVTMLKHDRTPTEIMAIFLTDLFLECATTWNMHSLAIWYAVQIWGELDDIKSLPKLCWRIVEISVNTVVTVGCVDLKTVSNNHWKTKEGMSLLNKNIDERSKNIVFGYIHEIEQLFKLEIPPLVVHLCLVFYFMDEFFAKVRDDFFKLSQNKLKVRNIHECGFDHTIFCNQWIESTSKCIVKWTSK